MITQNLYNINREIYQQASKLRELERERSGEDGRDSGGECSATDLTQMLARAVGSRPVGYVHYLYSSRYRLE